ncbi:MAG: UDP-N-acetylmuramate:L-alanyl-gamma-D-glutamyl-meso-diaminopimelate ligase [Gammaproteobacteria bacterium]|nr:UDP-N-acetylmuramate:L-alanyl-gamma-D-glutamyl-meso-diaminopimelate ligase [Gammaproteobacteria bacterium]
MHVHILGICGTFMGGIAQLARAQGHTVTGCDQNVYPPMSTQLAAAGIDVIEGYDPQQLTQWGRPDCIVIGNAMSRGNVLVEAILNSDIPYTSGPQWLAENVLQGRWVLAVAGTHGKTTTSSILAWILEYAGMQPGFLIGGVAENFGISARLGSTPFFVIEADEYDTAFFDKRSKFVHYHPRTLILNNLEFDHADIFENLAAIQQQFNHLIRTVPSNGQIIVNAQDQALADTLAKGCWSQRVSFGASATADWQMQVNENNDFTVQAINQPAQPIYPVQWSLLGEHNRLNTLAAIAAAQHVGVPVNVSVAALAEFIGIKRRMEIRGTVNEITVYDDFAHHPTAIRTTLQGLRDKVGNARIIAVLEPRSNTMRMGIHKDTLIASLAIADDVWLYLPPNTDWALSGAERVNIRNNIDDIVKELPNKLKAGDHVLVMSNGGFGNIHARLLDAL